MNRVKEKLKSAEQKRKVFKQQQCIFMTALERSRDQAQDKTKPVCSVAQVQWYMEDHCSNTTDRRILSLFLEIMEDLMEVLDILEGLGFTGSLMENCRILLCPTTDISNLRAQFPHDEVNRLSCVEARNYYGGVVSLIPVAVDLLRETARTSAGPQKEPEKAEVPKPQPTETVPQQAMDSYMEDQSASQNGQSQTKKPYKETGGWNAGKPSWKPPGRPKV
ncbi:sperm acrosome-associated protein 9 [Anguilla anguilla]|uniref:sperm acrosome-associated protein 9 n=1 Tax=Anguilla anguilla TaxID=7936 RepID=UPI0015AB300E|nr:sperm acrosome-associated protein 9 [Anguilla anguilla]